MMVRDKLDVSWLKSTVREYMNYVRAQSDMVRLSVARAVCCVPCAVRCVLCAVCCMLSVRYVPCVQTSVPPSSRVPESAMLYRM